MRPATRRTTPRPAAAADERTSPDGRSRLIGQGARIRNRRLAHKRRRGARNRRPNQSTRAWGIHALRTVQQQKRRLVRRRIRAVAAGFWENLDRIPRSQTEGHDLGGKSFSYSILRALLALCSFSARKIHPRLVLRTKRWACDDDREQSVSGLRSAAL
jgi:hypothetical protein